MCVYVYRNTYYWKLFKILLGSRLAVFIVLYKQNLTNVFSQIHNLHAVPWQVSNYLWFLSLHLFACLSSNYHIVPTVPVKVKQTERLPTTQRDAGRCTHGYPTVSVLCFNSGKGVVLAFLWHILCWNELTCSPGAAVEGREWKSERIYTWQG